MENIRRPSDLKSLGLVSKKMSAVLVPHFYRDLFLPGNQLDKNSIWKTVKALTSSESVRSIQALNVSCYSQKITLALDKLLFRLIDKKKDSQSNGANLYTQFLQPTPTARKSQPTKYYHRAGDPKCHQGPRWHCSSNSFGSTLTKQAARYCTRTEFWGAENREPVLSTTSEDIYPWRQRWKTKPSFLKAIFLYFHASDLGKLPFRERQAAILENFLSLTHLAIMMCLNLRLFFLHF